MLVVVAAASTFHVGMSEALMDLAVLEQMFEMYNEYVEEMCSEDFKRRSLGINPAQVIAVLRVCMEGVSSQREAALRLHMKQPAVNKWLEKFCEAGLIECGSRQKDGSKGVRLTPAGCELVAKLESLTDKFLAPPQAPSTSPENPSKRLTEQEDIGEPDLENGKGERIYQRYKAMYPDRVRKYWKRKPKVPIKVRIW